MNSREEKRRENVGIVISTVQKNGSVTYENMLMGIMYQVGVSRRTAKEYVFAALGSGFIERVGDLLKFKDGEQTLPQGG